MRTIAYLGPEHTNTHVAAQTRFGKAARYVHAPRVDDVFYFVEQRRADYGIVPIENSLEGAVTHTLDRFIDFIHSPVTIHGEIEQPIGHSLILHKGVRLSDLRIVYSHPQALAQCSQWLDGHLPGIVKGETNSTAEAVRRLDPHLPAVMSLSMSKRQMLATSPTPRERAAIARAELAQGKKLRAIAIPESRENRTRFLILGISESPRGKQNKTSILFALKDKPGALHDALMPFKRHRINLTKIESRPSKQKAWEYLFFIDFEGHVSEPRVTRALTALKRSTTLLRVLGSYPMTA